MNNKKKNNIDEVNLVQALSDIVNTNKLSELEYETDLCKIKNRNPENQQGFKKNID